MNHDNHENQNGYISFKRNIIFNILYISDPTVIEMGWRVFIFAR